MFGHTPHMFGSTSEHSRVPWRALGILRAHSYSDDAYRRGHPRLRRPGNWTNELVNSRRQVEGYYRTLARRNVRGPNVESFANDLQGVRRRSDVFCQEP